MRCLEIKVFELLPFKLLIILVILFLGIFNIFFIHGLVFADKISDNSYGLLGRVTHNEQTVLGAKVLLFDQKGYFLAESYTQEDGLYRFKHLNAGKYKILAVKNNLSGWTPMTIQKNDSVPYYYTASDISMEKKGNEFLEFLQRYGLYGTILAAFLGFFLPMMFGIISLGNKVYTPLFKYFMEFISSLDVFKKSIENLSTKPKDLDNWKEKEHDPFLEEINLLKQMVENFINNNLFIQGVGLREASYYQNIVNRLGSFTKKISCEGNIQTITSNLQKYINNSTENKGKSENLFHDLFQAKELIDERIPKLKRKLFYKLVPLQRG